MMSGAVTSDVKVILKRLSSEFGGVEPTHVVRERPDGAVLIVTFASPNERVNEVLARILSDLGPDHPMYGRVVIQARESQPADVVSLPEARMLQKELSESLTVDRNTFGEEFPARYIQSVTDHEVNVVGNANYIVYGRRGSGKSSLLAYAMHYARERSQLFSWVALQTYSAREDVQAICSVLADVFTELFESAGLPGLEAMVRDLRELSFLDDELLVERRLNRVIPLGRSLLKTLATSKKPVTIFLDDLHVVGSALQPRLLSAIYSMTRGNNCYIKVSGIEQFTNAWEGGVRIGLESPHDAQILKLDHNLTMPDRSRRHIVNILDSHARYCALPGIGYLAEESVLSRLVLIAAAVPRDALSLFSQAITKSLVKGQKAVTITALNAAASEAVEEKMKDVGRDAAGKDEVEIRALLERLKDFCVRQVRTNAFLVRIDSTSANFQLVQRLIALRFVHVLHEGITPNKVAERYVALMLDFGFYIGVRAARSIKLFPSEPKMLAARELRTLPIFDPSGKNGSASKKSKVAVSRKAAPKTEDLPKEKRGVDAKKKPSKIAKKVVKVVKTAAGSPASTAKSGRKAAVAPSVSERGGKGSVAVAKKSNRATKAAAVKKGKVVAVADGPVSSVKKSAAPKKGSKAVKNSGSTAAKNSTRASKRV